MIERSNLLIAKVTCPRCALRMEVRERQSGLAENVVKETARICLQHLRGFDVPRCSILKPEIDKAHQGLQKLISENPRRAED
jgi:hypothetical protein